LRKRNAETAHGTERRLLGAYVAVFATVLVVSAVVLRLVFAHALGQQLDDQVELLLRAAVGNVDVERGRPVIGDEISTRTLVARDQGVEWFDASGRRIAQRGLASGRLAPQPGTRERFAGARGSVRSASAAVRDPNSGRVVATVRAIQSETDMQDELRRLDIGLVLGCLIGLVLSGLGGWFLGHAEIRRLDDAFRTLREFGADASHELRGPLTAILGNASAALRDPDASRETATQRLESIVHTGRRMARTLDDLLLLSRGERPLPSITLTVDVAEIVRSAATLYAGRFETAGVALNVACDDGVRVEGDPDEIERLVVNLLDNALRHTPRGGIVTVRASRRDETVRLDVEDTGEGIARTDIPHVFERYWRGTNGRGARSRDGTGLGLAIVRAVARRHGGDVTASSEPGTGSRFTVTLPSSPGDPAPSS
jgi:OmpR-family two-component system manganese-sensing sensor histidine kinase